MSLHSLESERNTILERMQMSRGGYRHMLADDDDDTQYSGRQADAARHASPSASPLHPAYAQSRHTRARGSFPRSATMKLLTRHPLACAIAVAAVVVIGPRRLLRTALTSGTTVTALTLRNQANIDMIGRLIAMAGQYAQRSRSRR